MGYVFRIILLSAIVGIIYCCEIEESKNVQERYACNKTQTVWTKEKCYLVLQCDRQVQRTVPSECIRNVTLNTKLCCDGYRRDVTSGSCVDIDECLAGNHDCGSLCTNTPGSFNCECETGFLLAEDMKTCIDLNECLESYHNCSHSCLNTHGSFSCLCPNSLRLNDDGRTCEDIATSTMVHSISSSTVSETSTMKMYTLDEELPIIVTVSSYRVAERISMFEPPMLAVWLVAGIAVAVVIILVGLAFVYRRRRNQWPWFRIDGISIWKKSCGSSPSNSVVDMINTSVKSKVLDNSAMLGLDTSKARVFKRNPLSKAGQFTNTSTSNKCSVAFSTCSAVTGASSITLMCPNVIAGTEACSNDHDGNHIYCELRDSSVPVSSTPTNMLNGDCNRPISPCYASLPIAEVPLLTPVTSPLPNEQIRATDNVYNVA